MITIFIITLVLLLQVSSYAFNTNQLFPVTRNPVSTLTNHFFDKGSFRSKSLTLLKSTSSKSSASTTDRIKLTLAQSYDITTFLQELSLFNNIAGVFVLETVDNKAYYIGSSANIVQEVETFASFYKSLDFIQNIRVQTFSVYNPIAVEAYKQELARVTNAPANLLLQYTKQQQQQQQSTPSFISDNRRTPIFTPNNSNANNNNGMSEIERKLQSLKQIVKQTPAFSSAPTRIIEFQESTTPSPTSSQVSQKQQQQQPSSSQIISPFDSSSTTSSSTTTAKTTVPSTSTSAPASPSNSGAGQQMVKLATCETTLDFTVDNINKVLDQVRPMLISDGGNVAVVSIDKVTRSVKLLLQGACGSCPSSTTTMKMGIERVLKENFVNLGPVTGVSAEDLQQELINDANAANSTVGAGVSGTGGNREDDVSSSSSNTNSTPATATTTTTTVESVVTTPSVGEIIEKFTAKTKAADVLTKEKVTEALSNIEKAIKGLGGKIELISVNGTDELEDEGRSNSGYSSGSKIGQVKLKFQGPVRLRKGVELVLKDISSVTSVIMLDFE